MSWFAISRFSKVLTSTPEKRKQQSSPPPTASSEDSVIIADAQPNRFAGITSLRWTETHGITARDDDGYDPQLEVVPLSDADRAAIERLDGTDHIQELRARRDALLASRAEYIALNPAPNDPILEANTAELTQVEAELALALEDAGFEHEGAFVTAANRFVDAFRTRALSRAKEMLDANRGLVEGELARLRGQDGAAISDAMVRDITRVAELEAKAAALQERLRGASIDQLPAFEEELGAIHAELDALKAELGVRYPVLSDPELDFRAMTRVFPSPAIPTAEALREKCIAACEARLGDIAATERNLATDHDLVWKLDAVVKATRAELGIQRGSSFDAVLAQKIDRVELKQKVVDIALSALAIGAGVLSGVGIVGAGYVALGASTFQLGRHIEAYLVESAAYGTDFDRAKALSTNEPSLIWLAIDIIATAFDLGAFAKGLKTAALGEAFEELSPFAKRAVEAADGDAAKAMKELSAKTRRVADSLADRGVIKSADAFHDRVMKSALGERFKKDALAHHADAVQEIQRAVAGLDADSAAGLLRIEPKARGVLIKALAHDPDGLARVSKIVAENEDAARGLARLAEGIDDPAAFAEVARDLSRFRDPAKAERFLAELGGVDARRLAKLSRGDVASLAHAEDLWPLLKSIDGKTLVQLDRHLKLIGMDATERARTVAVLQEIAREPRILGLKKWIKFSAPGQKAADPASALSDFRNHVNELRVAKAKLSELEPNEVLRVGNDATLRGTDGKLLPSFDIVSKGGKVRRNIEVMTPKEPMFGSATLNEGAVHAADKVIATGRGATKGQREAAIVVNIQAEDVAENGQRFLRGCDGSVRILDRANKVQHEWNMFDRSLKELNKGAANPKAQQLDRITVYDQDVVPLYEFTKDAAGKWSGRSLLNGAP